MSLRFTCARCGQPTESRGFQWGDRCVACGARLVAHATTHPWYRRPFDALLGWVVVGWIAFEAVVLSRFRR